MRLMNVLNRLQVMVMKNVSLLIASMLLFGCASDKIEIQSAIVDRPKLELSSPTPIKMNDVKWVIITKENFQEVLKNTKGPIAFFALTENGYENLSLNMAEIKRYILEQKLIISSYKDYYDGEEEKEKEK